jgi:hypothetical protein
MIVTNSEGQEINVQEILAEGISLLLSRWPVLKVAVEEEWGGHESHEKLEWLIDEMIGIFSLNTTTHGYSLLDIELILEDVLSTEFNVEVEDNSIAYVSSSLQGFCVCSIVSLGFIRSFRFLFDDLKVARFLMRMYENCLRNDYSDVIELRERLASSEVQKIPYKLHNDYPEDEVVTNGESMKEEETAANLLQKSRFDSRGTPLKEGDRGSADSFQTETEDGWHLVSSRRSSLRR